MIKILLIFILFTNNSFANSFSRLFDKPRNSEPTSQGTQGSTIASLSESCQKFNNLSTIAQVYIPAIWPRTGFPGTVASAIQYRSTIINLCDYLIKLDRLANKDAILHTEAFLNNLTGNKFNDHLALQDSFFNVANSLYDFNNGGFRKGALTNPSTHRQIVSAADKTVSFYNKHVDDGGGGEGLETQADRKRQLDEVANLAYKRSILSEATSCPEPKGRTDGMKVYQKEILPKEREIDEAERDIRYFRKQLFNMGQEIYKEIDDFNLYTKEVDELIQGYSRYNQRSTTFSEASVEWSGKFDREGLPIKKEVPANKKVNIFSVSYRDEIFNEFRQKNVPRWETFVSSQFLSTGGVTGLLDGKRGRIEEKYRKYSHECATSRIENRLRIKNRNDPAYSKELRKEKQKCRKNLKVRETEFENLLDQYVNMLKRAVRTKHSNTVEIWNFEASTLGFNRSISTEDTQNPDSYQNMEVVCSETLEPAEMDKLALDIKQVKVEMRQKWMESKVKRLEMKKAKTEAQFEESQKNNKMMRQSIEQGKESSFSNKNIQPIPSIKTGL